MPLRNHLPERHVDTSAEKGWFEKDNGDLLDLAEREEHDVLVTTDPSIRYQQNLEGRRIAIVVLLSVNWKLIRKDVRMVTQAIDTVTPGDVIEDFIGP